MLAATSKSKAQIESELRLRKRATNSDKRQSLFYLFIMSINSSWEARFQNWKSPASDIEEQRCDNAERVIRTAISNSTALAPRQTRVFAQGSLRNNTNAKQHSDVDICVLCRDTFYYNLDSTHYTRAELGLTESSIYDYWTFKSDVHQALLNQFGADGVTQGNKAFDVHANSYRVDADVIAAFEHRRYSDSYRGYYDKGFTFLTSQGDQIENWPEQHYDQGVAKNKATNYQFKSVVRIFKRLRYEMMKENIASASGLSSFAIECMIYNVPDGKFNQTNNIAQFIHVWAELGDKLGNSESCADWVEVSGMKYLFRDQESKRQAALNWVIDAWHYVNQN